MTNYDDDLPSDRWLRVLGFLFDYGRWILAAGVSAALGLLALLLAG